MGAPHGPTTVLGAPSTTANVTAVVLVADRWVVVNTTHPELRELLKAAIYREVKGIAWGAESCEEPAAYEAADAVLATLTEHGLPTRTEALSKCGLVVQHRFVTDWQDGAP